MWNKFLRNPLHIVKDYELRKLLWQSGGGTAVCKKYLRFRNTVPEKLTFPENQVDEPIWLFWNTGLEQAPEIVKTCYQSIINRTFFTLRFNINKISKTRNAKDFYRILLNDQEIMSVIDLYQPTNLKNIVVYYSLKWKLIRVFEILSKIN